MSTLMVASRSRCKILDRAVRHGNRVVRMRGHGQSTKREGHSLSQYIGQHPDRRFEGESHGSIPHSFAPEQHDDLQVLIANVQYEQEASTWAVESCGLYLRVCVDDRRRSRLRRLRQHPSGANGNLCLAARQRTHADVHCNLHVSEVAGGYCDSNALQL